MQDWILFCFWNAINFISQKLYHKMQWFSCTCTSNSMCTCRLHYGPWDSWLRVQDMWSSRTNATLHCWKFSLTSWKQNKLQELEEKCVNNIKYPNCLIANVEILSFFNEFSTLFITEYWLFRWSVCLVCLEPLIHTSIRWTREWFRGMNPTLSVHPIQSYPPTAPSLVRPLLSL